MRASIADFEVLEGLPAGPLGSPRYLCRPPGRLGGAQPVEVVEVAVAEGRWASWRELVVRSAAVTDPGLLVLLEAGPDPDGSGAYLATEAAPGGSLGDPDPALGSDRRGLVAALATTARAAHALHERGLAHGGISPSAVVLTDRGPALVPPGFDHPDGFALRVADGSGLASVDPDLLRGEAPSRSSDIWSLGATLHQVMSDRELYPGIGADQAVTAAQRVLFTRPEVDPDLPAGLGALIARCLHPDPAERPETAAEVAELLSAGERPG